MILVPACFSNLAPALSLLTLNSASAGGMGRGVMKVRNRRQDPLRPLESPVFLVLNIVGFACLAYLLLRNQQSTVHWVQPAVHINHRIRGEQNRTESTTGIADHGDSFAQMVREWKEEEQVCRPPSHIDPDDRTTAPCSGDRFKCPILPPLTMLDQETGLLTHVDSKSHICAYSFFWRKRRSYRRLVYGRMQTFRKGRAVQMSRTWNLVNTSCSYKRDGSRFYTNTHLLIPTFDKRGKPPSGDKPSVLIFVLESLSQLSFHHFMKRTEAALKGLGGVQIMRNFVKPEENSFPNMMALLTGQSFNTTRQRTLVNKGVHAVGPFRFLWEEFRSAGYATAVEEDWAMVSQFKYDRSGGSPFDYCARSFWLHISNQSPWRLPALRSTSARMNQLERYQCAHSGPLINLFLDHTEQLMRANQDRPLFQFVFNSHITHMHKYNFAAVDPFLGAFFRRLKPLLNNTLLLFVGDHGYRFGQVVYTLRGRIEERMNLVSIRIPDSVNNKYPHLRQFIRANKDSLISWYDIHKMLQDFASGGFKTFRTASAPKLTRTGKQSFNPATSLIPRNRTCAEANIWPMYCVCSERVYLNPRTYGYPSITNPEARGCKLAINRFLSQVASNKTAGDSCQNVHVARVLGLSYLIPGNGRLLRPIERMEMLIRVSPSNSIARIRLLRDYRKSRKLFRVSMNSSEVQLLKRRIGC